MPTIEDIQVALQNRIRTDDPNSFNPATWKKVPLGITYDEDEELVDIAVYETTQELVETEGYFLPHNVWMTLGIRVNANHTPEQAFGPMMDAAQAAQPLPQNNEGPVRSRPSRRPTLRSARR